MRKSLVGIFILAFAVTIPVGAAVITIDDFEHRDPTLPGWTLADTSVGQPWGPGVYDPSSGALRVYHSGDELVTPGAHFSETAMFALWNASAVDRVFDNGRLRAKIRTDELQNTTSILLRGDLTTATGYLLYGGTATPPPYPEYQGAFRVSKFVNGVETGLWNSASIGIEYLPGVEWNVELGAVADRITGKVWEVGDAEPTTPQFSWIDPSPIPSGMIGISSDKTQGNTILTRGDATFDDIVFHAVPEPSAAFFGCVALVATACVRRKN